MKTNLNIAVSQIIGSAIGLVSAFFIALLLIWVGSKIGKSNANYEWNKVMVERGYKHYDQQTGELVWKDK